MTIQNPAASVPPAANKGHGTPVKRCVPKDADEDMAHLVTEDNKPVDNVYTEQQMRLLVEPLITNWQPGFDFWALANVGIYATKQSKAIVPDMYLSLHVRAPDDMVPRVNRCYCLWVMGKPPELAVEIVSNRKGGELGRKMLDYAALGVSHYVVFDPLHFIQREDLTVWKLSRNSPAVRNETQRFEDIGLATIVWDAVYEGKRRRWMRWTDLEGNLIPTGKETSEEKTRLAEENARRAESNTKRADEEAKRADLVEEENRMLREKLRVLGIEL